MPVNTKVQVRRGTSSSWTSTNPTLSAGEIGFETDTNRFKIGDGTTVWNSLKYNAVYPTGFLAGSGLSVNIAADGSSVTYSLSDPTIQVSDITDVTATASQINYLASTIPGTGVAGKAIILDSNLNISNLGNVSTTGTLTVGGNLIVNGTTTTVNSTTTTVDDPIFTIGGDSAPVGDDNKDRGIEFRYFNGSAKTGFFGYDDSTGKFTFIPDATNTSEVFSGTKGEVDANVDWSNVLNKPDPVITVNLTGDVTGSGNATLTDLASGTVNINTTVTASSSPIALGTGTTGQYASTIAVAGTGLSATSANADDGTAYTITSNATPANTANAIVSRDASGNFSAGTVTATQFSGGGSGLTNLNATNLSSGTVSSGLLPNVTVGSTSTGPTGSFVSSVTTDAKGRVTSVNTTTHTVATTSTQGIASFDSGNFSVSAGVVTIKSSGVGNSQLENDRITVGATPLVLGQTYSAISGVSAANPITLTYFVIDGGSP